MSAPEIFLGGRVALHCGDSREVLRAIPDASIHAVVTDPPYALVSIGKRFGKEGAAPASGNDAYARASAGFMGQQWDTGEVAFSADFWRQVFRVLKPGGHVVAFSGTRTYHRMACAIEDAGFEIRDQCKWMHEDDSERDAFLASLNDEQRAQFFKLFEEHGAGQLSWTYGSGFPKSHDVSKAIDKAAGAERTEVLAERKGVTKTFNVGAEDVVKPRYPITAPATPEAAQWQGWGTALKPAWEPICMARKPLDGTVAANVLAHGAGALNIDGCRIEWPSGHAPEIGTPGWGGPGKKLTAVPGQSGETVERAPPNGAGRWPANIVHDGSPEVILAFPETGASKAGGRSTGRNFGQEADSSFAKDRARTGHDDLGGSAARFFYQVEKDDRCDLCRVLLSGKNVKHLSCDAITAKPNSQIPNTHVEGTAHFDAAASQQPERGGKKLPSSSHVHVAGNRSEQCHQRRDNTALSDALTLEASRIAPSVRSAANLCGSCETDIARSLAATRLGLDPASLRCLEFMPEREGKILSQHLALYVAGRESIDTITTTASLKTLFGSVFHAIADTTNSEKAEGEENTGRGRRLFYSSKADADDRLGSKHPAVKPVDLMQWLCRLVTPPGGTVLDPFAGTGTTGEAAWREGFSAVLVEREAEYQADIRRRMKLALGGPEERKRESIKARHGDVEAGPLFSNVGAAE